MTLPVAGMLSGGTAPADSLRGRVALVTGSGHGLGACIARALAREGMRLVLNCRAAAADCEQAEDFAQELRRHDVECLLAPADVSDYSDAARLVEATMAAHGRIDVLVNAVDVFAWHQVAELDPVEWRRVLAANLDSVFHMCRLALPHMRRQHWGRILSLGAVGAERTLATPRLAAYSAAKAGVIAFSKALALEEARHGITVNVISPGVLHNGEQAQVESGDPMGDRVPVGRVGDPGDLARAVLFFASPSAGFVTGQVLAVAGGWHL